MKICGSGELASQSNAGVTRGIGIGAVVLSAGCGEIAPARNLKIRIRTKNNAPNTSVRRTKNFALVGR
jgi:hypothetical protein